MRQDLHLFIGEKEVEFSSDPKILFNYKLTETENPTVVKNSWTKQIEIPSTPANDDIFNRFFDLERMQYGGMFNAMIKAPFKLFINGELIEKGYCKLDSVKTDNHRSTFSVSLFGGLGSFFYNLSYDQSTEGNAKKSLASLVYLTDDVRTDPNLDFVISKETIESAWTTDADKWKVINFAPVYNGIPSDFDADKVMMNLKDSNFNGVTGVDGVNYYGYIAGAESQNGYAVGTMSEEMTGDEMFEFRSYLQRPIIRVKRIIEACAQPENNGGWEVKFDNHFFHQGNPYWEDAWMTLPLLRDLEIDGGETETITSATFNKVNTNRFNLSYNSTLGSLNNVRMRVNAYFTPRDSTTATMLYSSRQVDVNGWGVFQGSTYVDHYIENDGVVVQLIGRDTNGVICAASKAYLLSSKKERAYNNEPLWTGFWKEGNGYPEPTDYVWMEGKWVKSGNRYYFQDMAGNRKDIEFSFDTNSMLSSIEIRTMMMGSEYVDYKFTGKSSNGTPDQSFVSMWTGMTAQMSGHLTIGQVTNGRIMGDFGFVVDEFYGVATDYETLFSGTYIPKDKLLSSKFSPCDFLVSYCKLFGLYFYSDPAERSTDEERYPSGVIHIFDRSTFFTDEYVDLQQYIDRSKTMTITPTLAASKWYAFKYNEVDADAAQSYLNSYGYEYARALLNTGYNFNSDTTDLYKGNVFNNGVMVREKDKYFSMPINRRPMWAWNGLTYELYHIGQDGIDSTEVEAGRRAMASTPINTLGLPNYDLMSKLQCHGKENEGTDGDGILLFYRGPVQTTTPGGTLDYWITDDTPEMATLNGGNPCWLWTTTEYDAANNHIAIKKNFLPHYTRDLTLFGLQEGNIVHTWNFGHPQVTFVPNTYTTDGDCLYDKFWKSYCNDMFSVDGRKVSCYVRMIGKPGPQWLRKWYVWDNSIWRLNEIKDWNLADNGTVQCEFIKVQDVANYQVERVNYAGSEQLILNQTTVPHTGGTVTGQVILQSGGQWFSTDSDGVITGVDLYGNTYYVSNAVRPNTGAGATTNIQVVIPASSASTPITWHVHLVDDFNNPLDGYITQEGDTSPYLAFTENSIDKTAEATNITAHFTKRNMQTGLTASVDYDGQIQTGWVSNVVVDEANGVVTADLSANMLFARHAYIVLSGVGTNGNSVETRVQVSQSSGGAADLSVQPQTIDFEFYEGASTTKEVRVTYGGNWTITEE